MTFDYDDKTMYLICALRDIGLADIARGDQGFEFDGADFAAQFLEDNGVTDRRVDMIWDAIAAHTSGFTDSPVYRRRRPLETWIAVDGIGIDVGGAPTDLQPVRRSGARRLSTTRWQPCRGRRHRSSGAG
ncbi:hypothetical protein OH799_01800 [Nocardia sp. NBC_00881]|uniref:hypothetical protein n=1 Tax=Nocardia sp. NBC_00881 TaxID=2975995 RepID=UPI00386C1AE1|nr:hypothetical protein OH799_01800 [Nocardia sp. NBC_00881]